MFYPLSFLEISHVKSEFQPTEPAADHRRTKPKPSGSSDMCLSLRRNRTTDPASPFSRSPLAIYRSVHLCTKIIISTFLIVGPLLTFPLWFLTRVLCVIDAAFYKPESGKKLGCILTFIVCVNVIVFLLIIIAAVMIGASAG